MAQNDLGQMQAQIQRVINQYQQNPDAFRPDEVEALRDAAEQVGIKFKGDFDLGQMGKNIAYELADSVSFGGLSGLNSLFDLGMKPAKTNTYDDVGSVLGGLLGFAVPMGVGAKVASKAMGGLGRVANEGTQFTRNLASKMGDMGSKGLGAVSGKAPGFFDDILAPLKNVKATRGGAEAAEEAAKATAVGADAGMASKVGDFFKKASTGAGAEYADAGLQSLARLMMKMPNVTQRGIQGATAFGLSDVLEDPWSAPGNAIGGALTGGVGVGFGKVVKKLATTLKIPMADAEKLAAAYMYGQRSGDFGRDPYQLAMY